MNSTKLLHQELTGKIIGAYYDVYNAMSRDYPEYIYENALALALRDGDMQCQQQQEYQIFYKHKLVGVQKLDLIVDDEVVLELKHTPKLLKVHQAQLISYLKATDKKVGLLLNFGGQQPHFERFVYTLHAHLPTQPIHLEDAENGEKSLLYPELTYQIRQALYEVHSDLGPGFIARIYANACYHEFQLSAISAVPIKEMSVFYQKRKVGTIELNHFCVADKILVFPVAIENTADLKISNIKHWMRHCQIDFALIANFKETSLAIKTVTI
ncbi:GxxExxY protein [Candidatus Poribacteria bacterium]|nr:GxxExxY protein [Candidatus Poribacteria bacterium]